MVSRLIPPAITLCLCGLLYFGQGFTTLSDTVLDFLFQIRGPRVTSQSIVIIGVDEDTLDNLGAWPFTRDLHGSLLKQLDQAAAIGFDLLFSDSTELDATFNESIQLSSPVVFTAASDYTHKIQIPSATLYNFYGFGHIDSILGSDGVVRKTKLHQDSQLKAFSLVLLDAANRPVIVENPSASKLINFYGPEFTFLYLSYNDVLRGNPPPEFFKDRFVLIGAQAIGLGDVHVTPFTKNHPMPGVEVQATILNNLLEESFIQELPLFSWVLTSLFLFMSVFLWPTTNERRNILINITGVLVLVIISIWLFYYDLFFDSSTPLLFLIVSYFVHLSLQGIWVTRKLVTAVAELDHELEAGLRKIFTNIPRQLILPSKETPEHKFLTGGLRRHISSMRHGVGALTLQNQFINHLLKEEVGPLILWESKSGKVILANSMFNRFWKKRFGNSSQLPELHQFYKLLNQHKISSDVATPLKTTELDSSGRHWSVDVRLQHRGKTYYFKVNMHRVETVHSPFSGVLVSMIDITEIYELERMKSELLGVVSHELKLPLTTILGYSEMLSDSLDNEAKQYAQEISTEAKRLNQLIENFLDLAMIENGKYKNRQIPLDLTIVVLDAVNGVTHMADKKKTTIYIDIPSKVTPLVGDEPLLLQAIINVLDNAVKFSPPGSTIRVKLIEEKAVFVLEISDNGPGIAPKDHDTIFDKFNRGSNQDNREGFGLGLNLVKNVVENHEGTITILSPRRTGTTFRIILPKS